MNTIRNWLSPSARIWHELIWITLFTVITGLLGVFYWLFVPANYIVHGVQIANHDVGLLTPEQAKQSLQKAIPPLKDHQLILEWKDKKWATSSADLNWHYNWDQALQAAYSYGHQGSPVKRAKERLSLFWSQPNIPLQREYDRQKLDQWLQSVATEINSPRQAAEAVVQEQNYFISNGVNGYEVQLADLKNSILTNPDQHVYSIPVRTITETLSDQQLQAAEDRLQRLWGKRITVQVSDIEPTIEWTASDFFPWLRLPEGFRSSELEKSLTQLNEEYQTKPQNAVFELENDKLVKFQPHRQGRSLNIAQTANLIENALQQLEEADAGSSTTLQLVFDSTSPEVTLKDTNNLGVIELLGVGQSTFFGSIPNRVYNVELTSNRLHMTLVKPGDEFSFNQAVGEVSSRTGYKSAYVIRNGRTELGDGGGVCQVSTTTFRAALDAGLPITAWRPHSYRVGYYEQNKEPGFDATVYAPTTDFRFKNDTAHHLVVASYVQPDDRFMRVEIWGTNDNRQAQISNYQLYNKRPAPPPLYQPDPSLPTGVQKQIDWSSPGATASFDYLVTAESGETIFQKTFKSVYQPWQAVYLVGTQ